MGAQLSQLGLEVTNALGWEAGTLRYGLGTFAAVFCSWSCTCGLYALLDQTSWAQQYRIQPDAIKAADYPEKRKLAMRMVALNYSWLLPASVLGSPVLRRIFNDVAPAPPLWQAPGIALLWLVMHDASFYCYHRTLHEVPWLYQRFHKQHHVFKAPWAWSATATHPVEQMLQSIGGVAGPMLWAGCFGLPIRCFWMWLALIQVEGVMDHSGFDLPFPLDLFGMLPGFGGTKFHDDHHKHFTCNYAAVFSCIDKAFGTTRAQKLDKAQKQ